MGLRGSWLIPRDVMLPLATSVAHASDGIQAALELYAMGGEQDSRVFNSLQFAKLYLGKVNDVLLAVVAEGEIGATR